MCSALARASPLQKRYKNRTKPYENRTETVRTRTKTVRKPYGNRTKPYENRTKPYGNRTKPYENRTETVRKPYKTVRKPYETVRKPYETVRKPYGNSIRNRTKYKLPQELEGIKSTKARAEVINKIVERLIFRPIIVAYASLSYSNLDLSRCSQLHSGKPRARMVKHKQETQTKLQVGTIDSQFLQLKRACFF